MAAKREKSQNDLNNTAIQVDLLMGPDAHLQSKTEMSAYDETPSKIKNQKVALTKDLTSKNDIYKKDFIINKSHRSSINSQNKKGIFLTKYQRNKDYTSTPI